MMERAFASSSRRRRSCLRAALILSNVAPSGAADRRVSRRHARVPRLLRLAHGQQRICIGRSPGQRVGRAAECLGEASMSASALDNLRTLKNLTTVWEGFWERTGGKSSAGIDGITPAVFRDQLHSRLQLMKSDLERGYVFSQLRGVAIPKKDPSKLRLICVPTVADRLVQRAVLGLIEPRSAKLGIFNAVSYGFVRRVGAEKGGVHGARQLAIKYRQKWPWVFKADITKFFDNIRRPDLNSRPMQDFAAQVLVAINPRSDIM